MGIQTPSELAYLEVGHVGFACVPGVEPFHGMHLILWCFNLLFILA
jgi:hypothetical protein